MRLSSRITVEVFRTHLCVAADPNNFKQNIVMVYKGVNLIVVTKENHGVNFEILSKKEKI